jgi:aldehyde dehydrogenase (NAD+)
MSPADRVRLLNRVALTLIEHEDELAALEARDTGKPLRQARADARAVARYFEFYAGAADKLHGQTIPIRPAIPS